MDSSVASHGLGRLAFGSLEGASGERGEGQHMGEHSARRGGGSNSALHTINLRLQSSFGEMHAEGLVRGKALRALSALPFLPVYPVFEDEKSKGSTKNASREKLRKNITSRISEMTQRVVQYNFYLI